MSVFLDLFKDLPAPGGYASDQVLRDFGDGLVLRRAGPDDVEPLACFSAAAQADAPEFERIEYLAQWTRELLGGSHPRMTVDHAMLVEDTRKKRVASTLMLIPHHFRYAGVDVLSGQPELISTHPDYRGRGLVRAQFDVAHAWSAERGDALQFIEGIPYYYRQFGYELAIPSQTGETVLREAIPAALPKGVRVREAVETDTALLDSLNRARSEREMLFCRREAADWRFDFNQRKETSYRYRVWRVVEDEDGRALGAFAQMPVVIDGQLWATFVECAELEALDRFVDAVLVTLVAAGDELADDEEPLTAIRFAIGSSHPTFDRLRASGSSAEAGNPFYARVPEVAGFLRTVAPGLSARLADTKFRDYDGELKLSFYRSGVGLRFEAGQLIEVDSWSPDTEHLGDVAFPGPHVSPDPLWTALPRGTGPRHRGRAHEQRRAGRALRHPLPDRPDKSLVHRLVET